MAETGTLNMIQALNDALDHYLQRDETAVVLGEDVGHFGGVFRVTERGRRHTDLLRELRSGGTRAALVFLVQRADCERVAPADAIDPAYGKALRRAAAAGVEVYALSARVTRRALTAERELPVAL